MIFSWPQVLAFLMASACMGAFLFPSKFIQGQMHKQQGDRSASLKLFSEYLEDHPYHRGATLALIDAYEAAGRPEDAVPAFVALYEHRRGDADAGYRAVDLMRRCGLHAQADDFLWMLFNDLKDKPGIDRRRLEETLFEAYQRASARQQDENLERFLGALASWGGDRKGYRDELMRHFLSRRRFNPALAMLARQTLQTPKDPEPWRLSARVHRMRGADGQALKALSSGLSFVPDDLDLLKDRAELRAGMRRWDEAAGDYGHLYALRPAETTWGRAQAHALIQGGRFSEGIAAFEAVLAKAPRERENWMNIIYTYSDRKMVPETELWLKRTLEKFPQDNAVRTDLLNLYTDQKMYPQAESMLKDHLARSPNDKQSWDTLLNLYGDQKKHAEAQGLMREYLTKFPDDKAAWTTLLNLYTDQKMYAQAHTLIKDYLVRFPDDADAWKTLLYMYNDQKLHAQAQSLLKNYLVRFPADKEAWKTLLYMYGDQKMSREAENLLKDYLTRFSDDKEAWNNLLGLYGDQKKQEEVVSLLEKFVRKFPDDTDALDSLVYYYETDGRFDDAIALLRGYTARFPQDFKRRRALGDLLVQEGRDDEAIAEYERLVSLKPGESETWLYLAYMHERRRQYREAAAVYTRYLKNFPKDSVAVDKLASAYVALGERGKAIQVLSDYFGRPESPK